jgi:hypothetical protein
MISEEIQIKNGINLCINEIKYLLKFKNFSKNLYLKQFNPIFRKNLIRNDKVKSIIFSSDKEALQFQRINN